MPFLMTMLLSSVFAAAPQTESRDKHAMSKESGDHPKAMVKQLTPEELEKGLRGAIELDRVRLLDEMDAFMQSVFTKLTPLERTDLTKPLSIEDGQDIDAVLSKELDLWSKAFSKLGLKVSEGRRHGDPGGNSYISAVISKKGKDQWELTIGKDGLALEKLPPSKIHPKNVFPPSKGAVSYIRGKPVETLPPFEQRRNLWFDRSQLEGFPQKAHLRIEAGHYDGQPDYNLSDYVRDSFRPEN